MKEKIESFIDESIEAKRNLKRLTSEIGQLADILTETLKNDRTVLICGNGGSAADAQHFAAELTGRYKINRRGLPAIALTTDTSALTAIGNDFGFDEVFNKQVEGLCREGDLFVGISTSGNSENIVKAVETAKRKRAKVALLLGKNGGKLKNEGDVVIIVPSDNTPRIQECHELIIHCICELSENELFGGEQ